MNLYVLVHAHAGMYQMLPLQASKEALSWREPTGIHVHTVTYKNPVHTGTYYHVLVCNSTYWNLLLFTFLFRCWGYGVCAGHQCSGPTLSLVQHCRWYRQCSLCRLFVCTPPPESNLLKCHKSPTCWLSPKNPSYAWVVWLWTRLQWGRKQWKRTKPSVLHRIIGAGGRMERDQICFVEVCTVTFTYMHIPCSSMSRY